MTEPKISIIVPVYNAEKYLSRCIESVLKQSIDLELIIVNDGSRDGSQSIIDAYAERYPDIIRSLSIENSGAANARNRGLELAAGEYIGFVDSDDYVAEDMYSKLYAKAMSDDADIVACRFFGFTTDEIKELRINHMKRTRYGLSVRENPDIIIFGDPYVWNKIFRRQLLVDNNIAFDRLRIFEDMEFTYYAYIVANKVALVDEALYYYNRSNEASLTASFSEKFYDIFEAIKAVEKYAAGHDCLDLIADKLAFVTANHTRLRFMKKISRGMEAERANYIKRSFEFLDTEFPNWRESSGFLELKTGVTEEQLSPEYWLNNVKYIEEKTLLNRFKKDIKGLLRRS